MAECRICQGDAADGELVAPCACRGSMRYVHYHCLHDWCVSQQNFVKCKECTQEYFGDAFLRLSQFRADQLVCGPDATNEQQLAHAAAKNNLAHALRDADKAEAQGDVAGTRSLLEKAVEELLEAVRVESSLRSSQAVAKWSSRPRAVQCL